MSAKILSKGDRYWCS